MKTHCYTQALSNEVTCSTSVTGKVCARATHRLYSVQRLPFPLVGDCSLLRAQTKYSNATACGCMFCEQHLKPEGNELKDRLSAKRLLNRLRNAWQDAMSTYQAIHISAFLARCMDLLQKSYNR